MGGFSLSFHLQTENLEAVEQALQQTLSQYGTELVDVFSDYPGKPCPDANLGAALLIEPLNGWTSFVAEIRGGWDAFLEKLTRLIDCPALATYLDDGDYWGYMLFQNGKCLDDFSTMQAMGIDPEEQIEGLELSDILSSNFNLEAIIKQVQEDAANYTRKPVKDYNWNQHCEKLLPLMKTPSQEACLNVLTDLEIAAVSGLERFYALLDISTLFIEMSYDYMENVHPEDLEDESLTICQHWIVR